MPLLLTDETVDRVMTMDDCVAAMEDVFKEAAEGKTWNRPRSRIRMPRGFHHLMAASLVGSGVFGLKTYTSFRAGVRFLVLLYDGNTGDLLAMVQGGRLSLLRTGAVTGVATRHMAREDAATVGIIGTGGHARTQLAGVCAVRKVKKVRAFSRDAEKVAKFVSDMSRELGVEVVPAASAEEAVKETDIVITITTSRTPVLLGEWLTPGQHINAAGSNHWIRQEVDDDVVARANTIVVDSLEDAQVEAGDLLYPVERGKIRWGQVRELADVVCGHVPGRRSPQDITLFESQGVAISDIAAANFVYRKALEQGLGTPLPMDS